MRDLWAAVAAVAFALAQAASGGSPAAQESLARELRDAGRICYAARTPAGDWDLFTMRADGSEVARITNTPDLNEGMPRFSADGRILLYRRLPRDESFDGNRHGAQGELVIADRDGGHARALGKPGELPWASLSPDGKRLATLDPGGIKVVDIATLKVERTLPRQGYFQQLTWSPDGLALVGVSNAFGTAWAIGRIDLASGKSSAVSAVDCCTPDWYPDSRHLIYSNRPGNWTQLWTADADGKNRRLVYGEDGRHVYGGCVSPDGKYVIFTGNKQEDGDAANAGAPMAVMRLVDAPIVGPDSESLLKEHPHAKRGPVHPLPGGWEHCWVAPLKAPRGDQAEQSGGKP